MLVLASLLVACGPSSPSVDSRNLEGAADITVTMTTVDMSFQPDIVNVETGQIVAFVIQNPDNIKHDFSINDINCESAHVEVLPKQEVTIQITMPDEPGEWRFYCSIPGHESLGMEGTLIVD